MRIIVLDPGMTHDSGHHRAINMLLKQHADKSKKAFLVICSKPFRGLKTSPYEFIPVFPFDPYKPQYQDLELMDIYSQDNRTAAELLRKGLPHNHFASGDLVVIHTAFSCFLHGVAEWYRQLRRPDVKVRIIVRFPPFFRCQYRKTAELLMDHALHTWSTVDGDVKFFTDHSGLTDYFNQRGAVPFQTTPVAIDFRGVPEPQPRPPVADRGFCFVFAGDARAEKRPDLLPGAIRSHLKRYPSDRFRLQIYGASQQLQASLGKIGPQVLLFNQIFHGEEFYRFLASGDAVILPYEPRQYGYRTSHILLETLGVGRACVISPESWMMNQLAQAPNPVGVVMPSLDETGLVEAMHELRGNAQSYLQHALAYAATVRQKHNAGRWLQTFVGD